MIEKVDFTTVPNDDWHALAKAIINQYQKNKADGKYDAVFKKYDDVATTYFRDVLDEKMLTGNMMKLAAFRHLQDLRRTEENTDDFPYVYDLNEVKHILNFSKLIPDPEAKKPLPLMPWQQSVLSLIYGWRNRNTGDKRFDRAIVSVARANGKTMLSNIILTYAFFIESAGKTNSQMVYVAPVTDQANTGFNYLKTTFKYLKDHYPAFNEIFKQQDIYLRNNDIVAKAVENSITERSHKSGQFDSKHFICAVLDEQGSSGTTSGPTMINLIAKNTGDVSSGMVHQKNAFMFQISTAYDNPASIFYTDEKLLEGVMEKDSERSLDSYLCLVWSQDSTLERDHPETWEKSNPLMTLSPEMHAELKTKLLQQFESQSAGGELEKFENKSLNLWVKSQRDTYLSIKTIEEDTVKKPPINIDGRECYVGFDMSQISDDTSVSFIFPYSENNINKFYVKQHSWVPTIHASGSISYKEHLDGINYSDAEKDGYCTIIPGNINHGIIDPLSVFSWIVDYIQEHNLSVNLFVFDSWKANDVVNASIDQRTDIPTYALQQQTKNLDIPTRRFRDLAVMHRIVFDNDPILKYALNNAVLVSDAGGVKVDKLMKNQKIDAVDATIDAFSRAMYYFDDLTMSKPNVKAPLDDLSKNKRQEYIKNFGI